MIELMIGALSTVGTGAFMYLGSRFVARQTRQVGEKQVEVDQRKVDQEAFDRFIHRYEADRDQYEADRMRDQRTIAETRALLTSALHYVYLLRVDWNKGSLTPPPLPDELKNLPWSLYGDSYTRFASFEDLPPE